MADVKFPAFGEVKITRKNTAGNDVTSIFTNETDKEVTCKDTDFVISVRDGKEGAFIVCNTGAVTRVSTALANIAVSYGYLSRKGMPANIAADTATNVEKNRTAKWNA
jgi:hypothetical protein